MHASATDSATSSSSGAFSPPSSSYVDASGAGANNVQPLPPSVLAALERQRRALARVQGRLDTLAGSGLMDLALRAPSSSNRSSANNNGGGSGSGIGYGSSVDGTDAGADKEGEPAMTSSMDEYEREVSAVRQLLSELQAMAAEPDLNEMMDEQQLGAALALENEWSEEAQEGQDGQQRSRGGAWTLPDAQQLEEDAERQLEAIAAQLAAARLNLSEAGLAVADVETGAASASSSSSSSASSSAWPSSQSSPSAAEDHEQSDQDASSSSTSSFVWTRQWYPVAVLDCLDPARPHPFTLLGRRLVLWRDGSGAWRAFEDACPHR